MRLQKRKIIFFLAFPLLSALFIALAFFTRANSLDTESKAGEEESKVVDISGIPQIVTVHPTSATEGELFEYRLKITDSDTDLDNINVRIVEAPSWIFFREKFLLSGIPAIGDNNVQRVIIEFNDGKNFVKEEFYLLVKENDQAFNE